MTKTVTLRALRPMTGIYGKLTKDEEFEASESHARDFIRRNRALPVMAKMAAKPQNKMEAAPANKAEANPSAKSQDGGQTGAAKPSSSSQGAPARKKRVSKKQKAAAE